MNPLQRIEAMCAEAVERTFAVTFPSALEPVHVARKLVAAFEGGTSNGREGRRFLIGVHPTDFARFQSERGYFERQWGLMLQRLAERANLPQRPPEVLLIERFDIARGTVQIAVEPLPPAARLRLRVRRGLPADARFALQGTMVAGRDPGCDIVLPDPRVSRRHVEIAAHDGTVDFRDLGSANGVRLNSQPRMGGTLDCGDVLRIGDTELVVEAED